MNDTVCPRVLTITFTRGCFPSTSREHVTQLYILQQAIGLVTVKYVQRITENARIIITANTHFKPHKSVTIFNNF